jgi:hypothetical protein
LPLIEEPKKDAWHREKVGRPGILVETQMLLRMFVTTGLWLGRSLNRKSKKMLRKCNGRLMAF